MALGKFAAQSLLRTNEPITRLRGRVFDFRGALAHSDVPSRVPPPQPAGQARGLGGHEEGARHAPAGIAAWTGSCRSRCRCPRSTGSPTGCRPTCRCRLPAPGSTCRSVRAASPASSSRRRRRRLAKGCVSAMSSTVRDTTAFVPPALLALAQWVADYYLAGPGDVLATALPPRVLTGDERTFRRRRVAVLTAAGVHAAEQSRIGPRCAPPGDDAGDALRLGRRQREALILLAGVPAGLPAATLAARGISAPTLARLVQSGLVAVHHEAVDRDPFAAAFTLPAPAPPLRLTDEQQGALDVLMPLAATGEFRAALLRGVTGSGKTEIYLQLADHVRRQGRQSLLLVPEIALTPALAGRVRARFGERVAIQHSGLSDGERHDQWHRVRGGEVDVVVGTRSAVFAPLDRLGLIVVDEEHDTSYKQDESPRYHGRDVAVVRAQQAGALAVLGSATPSLETFHNAQRGRYALASLARRVADRPMAEVRIVNMRDEWAEAGEEVIVSRALAAALAARLEAGEQSLVLLNRRGDRRRGAVPAVRLDGRVPALQRLDDGARQRRARGGALPLLRLRPAGAAGLPELRGAVPRARRLRHRAGRGRGADAVPGGADRPRRSRHRPPARQPHGDAGALRPRRAGRAGRHPDDRQGPRLPAGHAGRRGLGRRRARPARLPRRRADLPADHPGGRPGRPRRAPRRGDRPDAVSRALRRALRQRAGLRRLRRQGALLPRGDALSADHRDDQRRGARPVSRRGDARRGDAGPRGRRARRRCAACSCSGRRRRRCPGCAASIARSSS